MLHQKILQKFNIIHIYISLFLLVSILTMAYIGNFYAIIGYILLGSFIALLKKRKISTYLLYVMCSSSLLFASNYKNIEALSNIIVIIYAHLIIFWSLKYKLFETLNLGISEKTKKSNFYFRWFLRYYALLIYISATAINLNFDSSFIILAIPILIYIIISAYIQRIDQ